jgi:hypothetical protein
VAAIDLRAWFYHTIPSLTLHASVIKRKFVIMMMMAGDTIFRDPKHPDDPTNDPLTPGYEAFRYSSCSFSVYLGSPFW